jgi:hypothetical protein
MNLLKPPESTEFYELEYSILKPDVSWDRDDDEYIVSVTPSHLSSRGGFRKMIIKLDNISDQNIKENIKSCTPFMCTGHCLSNDNSFTDRKNVRQSAFIRSTEDVEDDDDFECDCDDLRKIHITNTFFFASCIWVAKITKC